MSVTALAALGAACGDAQVCGPGEVPADGATAQVSGETLRYGAFTSSPNNDCTPPGAPLTSITLDGDQLEPAPSISLGITFCLPRPDQIGADPVTVGDPERLQLIDVFGELADGCLVQLDRAAQPTGSATFTGYCDDGSDLAGYAIDFSATIPVTRMCDGQPATFELGGSVAVETLVF